MAGVINMAAVTRPVEVDNNLSLRVYLRLAKNLQHLADVYRCEGNKLQLYVLLIRFISLVTTTIPQHKEYRSQSHLLALTSLKRQALEALDECEQLKPAVARLNGTSLLSFEEDYPPEEDGVVPVYFPTSPPRRASSLASFSSSSSASPLSSTTFISSLSPFPDSSSSYSFSSSSTAPSLFTSRASWPGYGPSSMDTGAGSGGVVAVDSNSGFYSYGSNGSNGYSADLGGGYNGGGYSGSSSSNGSAVLAGIGATGTLSLGMDLDVWAQSLTQPQQGQEAALSLAIPSATSSWSNLAASTTLLEQQQHPQQQQQQQPFYYQQQPQQQQQQQWYQPQNSNSMDLLSGIGSLSLTTAALPAIASAATVATSIARPLTSSYSFSLPQPRSEALSRHSLVSFPSSAPRQRALAPVQVSYPTKIDSSPIELPDLLSWPEKPKPQQQQQHQQRDAASTASANRNTLDNSFADSVETERDLRSDSTVTGAASAAPSTTAPTEPAAAASGAVSGSGSGAGSGAGGAAVPAPAGNEPSAIQPPSAAAAAAAAAAAVTSSAAAASAAAAAGGVGARGREAQSNGGTGLPSPLVQPAPPPANAPLQEVSLPGVGRPEHSHSHQHEQKKQNHRLQQQHEQQLVVGGALPERSGGGGKVRKTSGPKGVKAVHISTRMMDEFMRVVIDNTSRNLETCAVLAGSLKKGMFFVTALILPKQHSTSDSCSTTNEEEIFEAQDKLGLFQLGWIHTHPTQSCFMSSIDVHTHYSYQVMLPEAIAIVMAPMDPRRKFGIFRLTDPGGMKVIQKCPLRGFHSHEPTKDGSPIYTHSSHVFFNPKIKFDVVDLR
ncbi:unnamed protein product [Closterium sp. Naga37s-1]|nr:unnamed protein product [Closterium sp. Naga37s-1]